MRLTAHDQAIPVVIVDVNGGNAGDAVVHTQLLEKRATGLGVACAEQPFFTTFGSSSEHRGISSARLPLNKEGFLALDALDLLATAVVDAVTALTIVPLGIEMSVVDSTVTRVVRGWQTGQLVSGQPVELGYRDLYPVRAALQLIASHDTETASFQELPALQRLRLCRFTLRELVPFLQKVINASAAFARDQGLFGAVTEVLRSSNTTTVFTEPSQELPEQRDYRVDMQALAEALSGLAATLTMQCRGRNRSAGSFLATPRRASERSPSLSMSVRS